MSQRLGRGAPIPEKELPDWSGRAADRKLRGEPGGQGWAEGRQFPRKNCRIGVVVLLQGSCGGTPTRGASGRDRVTGDGGLMRSEGAGLWRGRSTGWWVVGGGVREGRGLGGFPRPLVGSARGGWQAEWPGGGCRGPFPPAGRRAD